MVRVCLVRHGETDWNAQKKMQGREDIELNNNGEKQALECAEYLRCFKWSFVVSSPLKRATKTAQIISENLNIEFKGIIDNLKERDFGVGSGMLVEEIKQKYGFDNIPGMETDDLIYERCREVLRYFECFADKDIIAVTHAGIIEKLVHLVGGKVEIDKIKNGKGNILEFNNNKWSVSHNL